MEAGLFSQYKEFLRGKIDEANLNDIASMGLAYIFDTAIQDGYKTFISGQGGDEIISDYALYPGQSTFRGVFPKELYEWPNFQAGQEQGIHQRHRRHRSPLRRKSELPPFLISS
jgi:asparagine synthetase B (glutamine-hydrolysing)